MQNDKTKKIKSVSGGETMEIDIHLNQGGHIKVVWIFLILRLVYGGPVT